MAGGLRDHLLVLGRFLRSPRQTGTIAPSSRALAREMVRSLDLAHARNVVELGPGTGAFTEAIVSNIGPGSRLLVVEIEPGFAAEIRRRWPSIDCVCASAAELDTLVDARGMRPVDHIVSGLPFASLPGAVTREILGAIERSLKPGGTFTTFQYVHAFGWPAAVAFRKDMNARLGGEPTKSLVLWNIPPAWVLTWRTRSLQDARPST
jgi:phosphatidylethanolamine/phosphatidyl-N-methylethanolamine N-methyltransferase